MKTHLTQWITEIVQILVRKMTKADQFRQTLLKLKAWNGFLSFFDTNKKKKRNLRKAEKYLIRKDIRRLRMGLLKWRALSKAETKILLRKFRLKFDIFHNWRLITRLRKFKNKNFEDEENSYKC